MLTQVIATEQTTEQLAARVSIRGRGLFCKKENRNAVAKLLKSQGYTVKITSDRGSRLHPQYVADFVGTYETGFGNCDYMTNWGTLFCIEIQSYPS